MAARYFIRTFYYFSLKDRVYQENLVHLWTAIGQKLIDQSGSLTIQLGYHLGASRLKYAPLHLWAASLVYTFSTAVSSMSNKRLMVQLLNTWSSLFKKGLYSSNAPLYILQQCCNGLYSIEMTNLKLCLEKEIHFICLSKGLILNSFLVCYKDEIIVKRKQYAFLPA